MGVEKTYILGISAFYHDAAACLTCDGELVAAVQEERFTRKKHDPSFPENAVKYCLKSAGITIKNVSLVAFYDKPFLKFERILETHLAYAPFGVRSFLSAIPPWIKQKLFIKENIRDVLRYDGEFIFPEHHHSHAASAFYPSPFDTAAVLTVDGVGEWATVSFGKGEGKKIELFQEIKFPHSLGLLYSAFTYYCGFKVNSGEYKLMGLAPYGEPEYVDLILNNLIDLKPDGSFKLDMKYFNYCSGMTMTNKKFNRLFGEAPRRRESELSQKHMDLAKSVQVVTEMAVMNMAKHVYKETGCNNLCLAGGVALNCVANGKVLREGPFDNIWIQPASSDAGGAIGAALVAWHEYLGKERVVTKGKDRQRASLLGPSFDDEHIESYLIRNNIPYEKLSASKVAKITADLIAAQKVIGWFQGKMEFGPRALGARSILGDPRSEKMQSIINRKIKFRESFRPFAPSIIAEKSAEYFDLIGESPYMLLVAPVSKEKRIQNDQVGLIGLEKLKVKRSRIPAITHVDYSARVQTVKREDNSRYYDMINALYENHGCPLVINTSFNVRGEPIVCTPEDAYKCFMRTNMDYLVMENFVIDKTKQDSARLRLEEVFEFELD
ncbi:MAG: carbamoyltransferase [Candidatus Omnitrophica bacterium]|nr:carbamoyltransferase [Candidatus Omnitrophota bacterium]MBU1895124.1 carbamoyltransferase [Candidatus Omnitrophota bacterium]